MTGSVADREWLVKSVVDRKQWLQILFWYELKHDKDDLVVNSRQPTTAELTINDTTNQ